MISAVLKNTLVGFLGKQGRLREDPMRGTAAVRRRLVDGMDRDCVQRPIDEIMEFSEAPST